MTSFLTRPGEELELIETFVQSQALRDLVELDGGTWPDDAPLLQQLEELESFSERWDFRRGDLRLVFHGDDESRTDERAQRVYSAARSLGMLDPSPPTLTNPDFILILGGLATGVEPRVRYAARLLSTGSVDCRHVVGLGSYRPVDDRERPAADRYAPEAMHELGLLAAMMTTAFGIPDEWKSQVEGDPELRPREAKTRIDVGERPALTALAAPSGDPDHRPANTADTYLQFADELVSNSSTALVITSSIYLPYQHMDAVRTLGPTADLTIESVGVPHSDSRPTHPPSSYLQEVRSIIRSARKLADQNTSPGPAV